MLPFPLPLVKTLYISNFLSLFNKYSFSRLVIDEASKTIGSSTPEKTHPIATSSLSKLSTHLSAASYLHNLL